MRRPPGPAHPSAGLGARFPAATLGLLLLLVFLPRGLLARESGVPEGGFQGNSRQGDALEEAGARMRSGEYDEAEELLRAALERAPQDASLQNRLGELLAVQGRLEEAALLFATAAAVPGPAQLTAEVNLAENLFRQGRREEAMRRFDVFIDYYNDGTASSQADIVAVGRACRYLGRTDPQLYRDALKAFDEASAIEPTLIEPYIRNGDLFLEKYNSAEAQQSYQEALTLQEDSPEALLGMARLLRFDARPEAWEAARQVLQVNPRMVGAHVLVAEMLLAQEDRDAAVIEAERALATDPSSIEALGIVATARYMQDDQPGYEEARGRALAVNPYASNFYTVMAEQCVQNRRYAEALFFASEAIRLDAADWEAHGLLGINLLRMGQIQEGRASLETAFAGDPYNIWFKNTLDLLDTFRRFQVETSDHIEAVLRSDEVGILAPYLLPLAEEARADLAKRYRYEPTVPVRVEVFPSHGDFSVRSVGLVGLGALGVCFGPVIAMDSPTARPPGEFNWGSTLWHEFTHTVSLGMSEHRVPRWFSEGLSVFEERRARPGWGTEIDLPFLYIVLQDRMLGIEELNRGFVRPRFPEEVTVSYFHASLICEWIAETKEFDALIGMLRAYGAGKTTREVLQEVLGLTPDAFDAGFETWVAERYDRELGALRAGDWGEGRTEQSVDRMRERAASDEDDFKANLVVGLTLEGSGDIEQAAPYLERAWALIPEYEGPDGPLPALARIHMARGDTAAALANLGAYTALNENDAAARRALAALYEAVGLREEAVRALVETVYIDPFEPSLHDDLAGHLETMGRWADAVTERGVAVALEPTDRVTAWYRLANAQFEAGDRRSARRSVLQALEIAPNYEAALDLLVRLQPPPPEVDREEGDR